MNAFEYYNPTKVIYGEHAMERIGEQAACYGKKVLLVSYRDVSFMCDKIDRIHASLKKAGVDCTDYFNVTANPTLAQAREGLELCKKHGIELVIGFGGGSVMDCAKIIAAGVFYREQDIARMIVFSHSSNEQVPPEKSLPTIMIPTLPATGSEMNATAVVTNEATKQKSYVWAPNCLFPKAAILDPALTAGLPPYQTACAAIDTVAHVAESYFNGNSGNIDIQDGMQEGVIKSVLQNLPVVLENPDDLQARGVMMWAASIALNGWLLSGTYGWAPMHQMGHVLSARYNATHGATLACMLVAWMRFFEKRKDNHRYVQFASRIFGRTLGQAADEFEQYIKQYGVEVRISSFGVSREDIDALVNDVVAISFGVDGMLGSIPAITKEDVKEIYLLSI